MSTEPKERPILFSGLMIEAILAGRKTQTRRVAKLKPEPVEYDGVWMYSQGIRWGAVSNPTYPPCPHGKPGDRLWVRETFERIHRGTEAGGSVPVVVYIADGTERERQEDGKAAPKRYPSIFMPRSLSRILLEVVSVRVERVNEISFHDAMAEGISAQFADPAIPDTEAISEYAALWDKINGPGSWACHPWVWVITFKRIEADNGR